MAEWIRLNREAKNLTAGHLAAKMGIAATLVRSWEGSKSGPGKEQMQHLTSVFGEAPALGIVG